MSQLTQFQSQSLAFHFSAPHFSAIISSFLAKNRTKHARLKSTGAWTFASLGCLIDNLSPAQPRPRRMEPELRKKNQSHILTISLQYIILPLSQHEFLCSPALKELAHAGRVCHS
jgi:hypothetical protein